MDLADAFIQIDVYRITIKHMTLVMEAQCL